MASTYVTVSELRSNLGIGTLYSDSDVESVCQTAQDLLNSYLWFDSAPVVGAMIVNNVATVMLANPAIFAAGQSITITNSGSLYNGTFTITGTIPFTSGGTTQTLPAWFWSFNWATWPTGYSYVQFSKTASDDPFHRVLPYGAATGPDTKTTSYAATPAIRQAAMILAVDIWQARQVSQTGGNGMDGFSPSPYRMGYQLMNRVRGLIQPYANPNALIG
jgi:hypothetical protein